MVRDNFESRDFCLCLAAIPTPDENGASGMMQQTAHVQTRDMSPFARPLHGHRVISSAENVYDSDVNTRLIPLKTFYFDGPRLSRSELWVLLGKHLCDRNYGPIMQLEIIHLYTCVEYAYNLPT